VEFSTYPTPQADEPVSISNVYIALAEDEIDELIGALSHMLQASERGPDSHYHLTDKDMREVTIWLVAP
jgi:hypothetical protein